MWNFLLSKLNAELYSKTLSIEGRNGFELYRQVVRAVDEMPENAKFFMGAEIANFVHKFGDKVTQALKKWLGPIMQASLKGILLKT